LPVAELENLEFVPIIVRMAVQPIAGILRDRLIPERRKMMAPFSTTYEAVERVRDARGDIMRSG
jgi:hypothetical protein